jgi:uncharacterized protein involved in exopolysaccharide biosynthesis
LASGSPIPGQKGNTVKLDYAGMRQMMTSPEVMDELAGRMARVQAALPDSEMRVSSGQRRARAVVARGSDFDEANTGDLSRALDLAGGLRGVRVKTAKPKARAN